MKSLVIDPGHFHGMFEPCPVTEAELLLLINTCLEEMMCSCTVTALRFVDSAFRNWEVASVELRLAVDEDANERLGYIGQLISSLTDGYEVAWPSTLLH
jgi:hypothetical protein